MRCRGASPSTESLISQTNESFPMSSMRALSHQAAQDRRIEELTPPSLLPPTRRIDLCPSVSQMQPFPRGSCPEDNLITWILGVVL